MAIAYVLHVLAALIWVGGMFFAHSSLRPTAAETLQPPERLRLLTGVFKRFFNAFQLAFTERSVIIARMHVPNSIAWLFLVEVKRHLDPAVVFR